MCHRENNATGLSNGPHWRPGDRRAAQARYDRGPPALRKGWMPNPGIKRNSLQRARTEVNRLVLFLAEHRALDAPHSEHWKRRDADYVRRLARAQVELEQLEFQQQR